MSGCDSQSDDNESGVTTPLDPDTEQVLSQQRDTVSHLMKEFERTSTQRTKSLTQWQLGTDSNRNITIGHVLPHHEKERQEIYVTQFRVAEYESVLNLSSKAESSVTRLRETMRKSLESLSTLRHAYTATAQSAKTLKEVNGELESGMKNLTQKMDSLKGQRDELSKKLSIFQQFVVDKDKQLVDSLKREKNNSKKLRGHLNFMRNFHEHRDKTIFSLFDIAKKQNLTVADLHYYYMQAMQEYEELDKRGVSSVKPSEIEQYFKTLEKVHENILEQTIRLMSKEGVNIQEDMYLQHVYTFKQLILDENIQAGDAQSDSEVSDGRKKAICFAQQTDLQNELPETGPYGYAEADPPLDGFRDICVQAESLQSQPLGTSHASSQTEPLSHIFTPFNRKDSVSNGGSNVDESTTVDLDSKDGFIVHKKHLNALITRSIDSVHSFVDAKNKQNLVEVLRQAHDRIGSALGIGETDNTKTEKVLQIARELQDMKKELLTLTERYRKEFRMDIRHASYEIRELLPSFSVGWLDEDSHQDDSAYYTRKRHKRGSKRKRLKKLSSNKDLKNVDITHPLYDPKSPPELLKYLKLMMKVKKRQLAKHSSKSDIATLVREVFRTFDINGDGGISWREAQRGMQVVGAHLSKRKCQQLLKEVDEDGSGEIEWSEFCRITLQEMCTPQEIEQVVANGFLTSEEQDDNKVAKERIRFKKRSSSKHLALHRHNSNSSYDKSDSDHPSSHRSCHTDEEHEEMQLDNVALKLQVEDLQEEVKELRDKLRRSQQDELLGREHDTLAQSTILDRSHSPMSEESRASNDPQPHTLNEEQDLHNLHVDVNPLKQFPQISIHSSTPIAETSPKWSSSPSLDISPKQHQDEHTPIETYCSDLQSADHHFQQNIDRMSQDLGSYSSRLHEANRKYDTSLLLYEKKLQQMENQNRLYEQQVSRFEQENSKYRDEIHTMKQRTTRSHTRGVVEAASPQMRQNSLLLEDEIPHDSPHIDPSTIEIYESQVRLLTEENTIIQKERDRTEQDLQSLKTENIRIKELYDALQTKMHQLEQTDRPSLTMDASSAVQQNDDNKKRASIPFSMVEDQFSPPGDVDFEYRQIALASNHDDDDWDTPHSDDDELDIGQKSTLSLKQRANSMAIDTRHASEKTHRSPKEIRSASSIDRDQKFNRKPQFVKRVTPAAQSLARQGLQEKSVVHSTSQSAPTQSFQKSKKLRNGTKLLSMKKKVRRSGDGTALEKQR